MVGLDAPVPTEYRKVQLSTECACMQAYGPLEEKALALVAFEVLKIVRACHDLGILHGESRFKPLMGTP